MMPRCWLSSINCIIWFLFYFYFLGLVVMGRHKREVIACLSSQMQCKLIVILCTKFMANKFDLIWFDLIHRRMECWIDRDGEYNNEYRSLSGRLSVVPAVSVCSAGCLTLFSEICNFVFKHLEHVIDLDLYVRTTN